MSEIQVLPLIATVLGIVATALNVVAFVREKDRAHTRAAFHLLVVLGLLCALVFLPRYAPGPARRLVAQLPPAAGAALQPWLSLSPAPLAAAAVSPTPPPAPSPRLQGSFTVEIDRNLLGGIGALMANFQFTNLSPEAVRITAYHVRLVRKTGEGAHSYDRVLSEPVALTGNGTGTARVELDAEIRDQWVAREDLEAAERGPMEISWDALDASGQLVRFTSSNG